MAVSSMAEESIRMGVVMETLTFVTRKGKDSYGIFKIRK